MRLHEANTNVGKMTTNGKANSESLRSLDSLGIGGNLSETKTEDKAWAAAVAL